MVKLTRFDNQTVVVNPDHIRAVEAAPETTLHLLGGDRMLVRESIEELVTRVVAYRRRVGTLAVASTVSVDPLAHRHWDDAEEDRFEENVR